MNPNPNSFWADVQPIKAFGLAMLITQMFVAVLFISFVRMEDNIAPDALRSERYQAFQDVNVMMLIGFGFLMTFIRTHSWSALSYTFFINALVI
jgi:ammonium transporter Rh